MTIGNMAHRADPALAQALSQPEAAQRWAEWHAVTGPHTSQAQSARVWKALFASGAAPVLNHHLCAVHEGKGEDEAAGKRLRAAGPRRGKLDWRTPTFVIEHW